jgi:hypothetical protein
MIAETRDGFWQKAVERFVERLWRAGRGGLKEEVTNNLPAYQ